MRALMLQNRERTMLRGFFEWLLNTRYFPKFVPNPGKKFLPSIRKEIKHLQKLQKQMNRPLTDAIACLETHEKVIATALPQYSSPNKTRVSGTRGNIEEAERLFLAARVAELLCPDKSPPAVVRTYLENNGYRTGERTIEARVRRFEKNLQPGGCRPIAEMQFGGFKQFRLWPRLEPLMRPGMWEKNCWRIARRLGLTSFEIGLIGKLCECSEKSLKSMPSDPSMQMKS
jgi:hypothetical protein